MASKALTKIDQAYFFQLQLLWSCSDLVAVTDRIYCFILLYSKDFEGEEKCQISTVQKVG